MRWIADRSNGVEPPIRRLIAILIDRGDDALGPARNIIAELLKPYDTQSTEERPRELPSVPCVYKILLTATTTATE